MWITAFKLPDHHRKNARENIAGAEIYNTDVIRTLDYPVLASGGWPFCTVISHPNGAVIKASAANEAVESTRVAPSCSTTSMK